MTTVTTHPPGSFCWIELATSDAASARAFYTGLFAWGVNEVPMGDEMGTYYIFHSAGRETGAMYQSSEMPPNWTSYIAVANVDETVEQVKARGGEVHAGPMDVFDMGRMAVIGDPQGAVFAIWQAKNHAGIGVRDQADALCWNELQARDVSAAKKFYPPLFGWRMKEAPDYTEWHLGENAVGGMLPSQAPRHVPSYWLPYFAVEDCEKSVAQAESLGGSILLAPMDIPNVGRFAVLRDPEGAVFAVIRLAM